jgi:penicillin-insensitive murein endopeptidase
MRRCVFLLSIACVIGVVVPASARTHGRERTISIGFAWSGRLQRGAHLAESRHVRYVGEYAAADHHYGTGELVDLIERAAARVSQRIPGARLSVGELSARGGGPIPGHRSHENGRDADIGFYMLDARGRPYEAYAFASFDANGVGTGPNRMLRFDDARNWELIARLVTDPDARVQHVFVSNALERRLLREGQRRRAPRVVLDRAAAVMGQPSGHPHRNHFHVRIYCSPGDRARCRDRAPYHAWYPGSPPLDPSPGLARGD